MKNLINYYINNRDKPLKATPLPNKNPNTTFVH